MPGTGLNSNVDTCRPFDLGVPALEPAMLILFRHSRVRALVCAQFADCTNFSCASVFKLTKFTKWSTEEKKFSLNTLNKHFCYKWSFPSLSGRIQLSLTQTSCSTKLVSNPESSITRTICNSPALRFYRIQPQIIRTFHTYIHFIECPWKGLFSINIK